MGNLLINHLTFAFDDENEDHFQSLSDFINAADHAMNNGDTIHVTTELAEYPFHWGQFHVAFAYSSWADIKRNEFWKWLPQPLHQLLTVFFYKAPSGRSDFSNLDDFIGSYADSHYGTIGCKCEKVQDLDVFNVLSWEFWKIIYLQAHPAAYKWKEDDDDFLPNKSFSNKILIRELKSHKKLELLVDDKIGVAFHDHVMRHKGPELQAFAVNTGTEIAEANYYTWEEQLSNDEAAMAGAPRKIFSNIGRDGKKMFISIDHAHGMFEYHDHNGKHKGEFKFDGSYNSGEEADHDLKTL